MPEKRTPHLSRDHEALGAAVRELRARRGLSQEELGFAAGLHRNYVGAVERGEINATFRTLLRLTVGLRVRLVDLIAVYERQAAEILPRRSRNRPHCSARVGSVPRHVDLSERRDRVS